MRAVTPTVACSGSELVLIEALSLGLGIIPHKFLRSVEYETASFRFGRATLMGISEMPAADLGVSKGAHNA